MKQRVTGIGGIFFKARNPTRLSAWYKKHLKIPMQDKWGGWEFIWRDAKNAKKMGMTVWGPAPMNTKYFGPGKQALMLNYRVGNLKKVLAQLKKEGVWVDAKTETSEYGKFGWIKDGEGNRVELWQPPAARRKR